jgi:hypothetical protein
MSLALSDPSSDRREGVQTSKHQHQESPEDKLYASSNLGLSAMQAVPGSNSALRVPSLLDHTHNPLLRLESSDHRWDESRKLWQPQEKKKTTLRQQAAPMISLEQANQAYEQAHYYAAKSRTDDWQVGDRAVRATVIAVREGVEAD